MEEGLKKKIIDICTANEEYGVAIEIINHRECIESELTKLVLKKKKDLAVELSRLVREEK